MNQEKRIELEYSRLTYFFEDSSTAYYNPLNQAIKFNKISSKRFIEKTENPSMEFYDDELKIIIHELRHYIDHVSTYWGQKNLVEIFNSYHYRKEGNVNNFPKLISFWNSLKRSKSDSYYFETVRQPINNKWIWGLTCGKRFDSKGKLNLDNPIIFTRFYSSMEDALKEKYFLRVPFSIGSLLEVNAKSEEISLEEIFIHSSKPSVSQMDSYKNARNEFLFDPNIAMYTLAAHYFANSSNINQISQAYSSGSQIATVALNIPDSLFINLKIPKLFQPWGDLNVRFLEKKDRGYLFACLVQNAKENNLIDDIKTDDLLRSSNFPTSNDLKKIIKAELELIEQAILPKDFLNEKLIPILTEGRRVFELREIDGCNYTAFDHFKSKSTMPFCLFSDSIPVDYYSLNSMKYSPKNDIEWIKYVYLMKEKIREFVDACGE